jgi:hypothetical protein
MIFHDFFGVMLGAQTIPGGNPQTTQRICVPSLAADSSLINAVRRTRCNSLWPTLWLAMSALPCDGGGVGRS